MAQNKIIHTRIICKFFISKIQLSKYQYLKFNMKETILITGAAGFIGFHLSKRLISEGYHVVGLDNLNKYYDVNLKLSRLKFLNEQADSNDSN